VLRTDLSEQFVIIASDYPQVKYQHFKKFVRNSIEYSFLQDGSIWLSKGDYSKMVAECSRCTPAKQPDARYKAFLNSSDKATVQWELERDLIAFEKRLAARKNDAGFQAFYVSRPHNIYSPDQRCKLYGFSTNSPQSQTAATHPAASRWGI